MSSPSEPAIDPFLAACNMQRTSQVPVWFMRQAGRSLPEYRAARGSGSILQAIQQPELAAELTLQPVRRYGVDAAILFSDIVVPLAAIGAGVDVVPGRGPVLEEPFRSVGDLRRLRQFEPDSDAPYVAETVKLLVNELKVPLIGFGGAPFTLASYLIEGGPSRTFGKAKAMMRDEPVTWAKLLDVLADIVTASMRSQVHAGAKALQLFDSWVGTLSAAEYEKYVMPASCKVLAGLADLGVPRIHFGVGTGELLWLMGQAGADVVGVDWRIPLSEARRRIEPGKAVQGNLDPTVCLSSWATVKAAVQKVISDNGGEPGHIFNLGHGVLPETDPGILTEIVAFVHDQGIRA